MKMKRLYEDLERATPQQKERIWEVVDDVFEEIERKFPDYYKKYKHKLHTILDNQEMGGESLSEHEAREQVAMLRNPDGSRGEHWDKKTIKSMIESYPQLYKYPFWDTYYALNAVYSKFYDPSYGIKNYVKMATQLLGVGEDMTKYYGAKRRGYGMHEEREGYDRQERQDPYMRGGGYDTGIGFVNTNRGMYQDYDHRRDREEGFGYGRNYRQDGRGEGRDPFARMFAKTY